MAIQEECRSSKAPTAKVKEGDVLIIEVTESTLRIQGLLLLAVVNTRVQSHQAEDIPQVKWQLDGLALGHVRGYIGIRSIQHRGGGRDRELLGDGAELQGHILARRLSHRQHNPRLDVGSKTRFLHLQGVRTRW